MAIKRLWHGWTTKENANKYQNILTTEVLPGIEKKNISGYKKMEVLRIDREEEVEFIVIMTFESLENVKDFQGENYKKAYVPEKAQKVLKKWDLESTHYELIETRRY